MVSLLALVLALVLTLILALMLTPLLTPLTLLTSLLILRSDGFAYAVSFTLTPSPPTVKTASADYGNLFTKLHDWIVV